MANIKLTHIQGEVLQELIVADDWVSLGSLHHPLKVLEQLWEKGAIDAQFRYSQTERPQTFYRVRA